MFFWSQHNLTSGGMEPVFQYAYDPNLYWMAHRIEIRQAAGFTSPSPPRTPPEQIDTFTALTQRFKASYLLIVKVATPGLYDFARSDPRFVVRYDSETVVIFELPSP